MIRFHLTFAEELVHDIVKLLLSTQFRQMLQVVVDLALLREDVGQVVERHPLLGELLELGEDLHAGHSRTVLDDVVELEQLLAVAFNMILDSRLDTLQVAQQLANVDLVLSIQSQQILHDVNFALLQL